MKFKKILTFILDHRNGIIVGIISGICVYVIIWLFGSVVALIIGIITKVSIKDSFVVIYKLLNYGITIKLWLLVFIISFLFINLFWKNKLFELLRNFVLKFKKTQSQNKLRKPILSQKSTLMFAERIADAFPGVRGLKWTEQPKVAVKILEILLKKPLTFTSEHYPDSSRPICWFRGDEWNPIYSFRKLSSKIILINDIRRMKISRIAINQENYYYKNFVYIEVKSENQTGLYDIDTSYIKRMIANYGYANEQYGLTKKWFGIKKYLKREEYDDGATVVRGKVKNIDNPKLRIRYLSNYNFIITAKGSPYNSEKFIRNSKKYLNGILSGNIETNEFFEFMSKFSKFDIDDNFR